MYRHIVQALAHSCIDLYYVNLETGEFFGFHTEDRDGMLTGRMVFREGTRDSFPYNTPYGQMLLGIDTRKIRHNFNENGGDVEIDYVTDLANYYVTKNKFRISVKEMEKSNG